MEEVSGRFTCSFTFEPADVKESVAPVRQGMMAVVPTLTTLKKDFPGILDDLSNAIGDKPTTTEAAALSTLHCLF